MYKVKKINTITFFVILSEPFYSFGYGCVRLENLNLLIVKGRQISRKILIHIFFELSPAETATQKKGKSNLKFRLARESSEWNSKKC